MLHTYRHSHITFLRSPRLEAVPGVVHAFSTRRGASGDLTLDGASSPARDHFAAAVGMAGWPVSRLLQMHSNTVYVVRDNGFANATPEGDAAVTDLGGLALGVVTADCTPILVADRGACAVAAVHAGWRGTAEGVARKAVEAMVRDLALDASGLVAAIGPRIGVCCMEVGEEVYDWFGDPSIFERRPTWERPHLDLGAANLRQLLAAGVPADSVDVSGLCTRCRGDLFHSHRRDGKAAGRMLTLIGIEAT